MDTTWAKLPTPVTFENISAITKVSKLNASENKTAPGLVLKVMVGDKVRINTHEFYNTAGQIPSAGANILPDLLTVLTGDIISHHNRHKKTSSRIGSLPML